MLTALALSVVVAASPDGGVDSPLVDLARAWEATRLFHPSAVHGGVDLDAAFVAAVPAAEAASTPEARAAAVQQMLSVLKDPLTRVRPEKDQEAPRRDTPALTVRKGYAVFDPRAKDAAPLTDYFAAQQLAAALADHPSVVVDLRGLREADPFAWSRAQVLAPAVPVTLPREHMIVHHGYSERAPSLYSARLEEQLPAQAESRPANVKRRWAFVMNPDDYLPHWAWALREAGAAVLVSSAELGDDVYLGTVTFALGAGNVLDLRVSELSGGHSVRTDVKVKPGQDPIEAAGAALLARRRSKQGPARASAAVQPFSLADRTTGLPGREGRLLAGVRLWTVARRFWAYGALGSGDPDAHLVAALPRLAAADTDVSYRQALEELAAKLLPDAHVWVVQPAGRPDADAPVSLLVTEVEGRFVIKEALGEAKEQGLSDWDVLVAIDGEPVAQRIARLVPRIPAPSPAGRTFVLRQRLISCPAGQTLAITAEGRDGKRRTAKLPCDPKNYAFSMRQAPSPHYKVLPGNVGFVDLAALTSDEVNAMFEALSGTRAIVFDDRGYPKGTGFDIGPRLGTTDPPGFAQLCAPVVRATDQGERACEARVQRLPPWKGARYTRPTVTLLDDRAISQSEHTALIFEAYAHTTFVGSPTVGANGNVSSMSLPGGYRVLWSGLEVRHLDGRQLQTVGITPHVLVKPTLAGLRAGRDEVLEKAIELIDTKLAPAKKK